MFRHIGYGRVVRVGGRVLCGAVGQGRVWYGLCDAVWFGAGICGPWCWV